MATNTSSKTIKRLTDDITLVPFGTAVTGKVSSSGIKATGVGTAFNDEFQRGSIIWNLDYEWRRVKNVISDTEIALESAFSVDLSSADVEVLPPNQQNAKEIDVFFIDADGTVITTESALIPAGLTVNLSIPTKESSVGDLVDPMVVDAQGTVAIITLIRY